MTWGSSRGRRWGGRRVRGVEKRGLGGCALWTPPLTANAPGSAPAGGSGSPQSTGPPAGPRSSPPPRACSPGCPTSGVGGRRLRLRRRLAVLTLVDLYAAACSRRQGSQGRGGARTRWALISSSSVLMLAARTCTAERAVGRGIGHTAWSARAGAPNRWDDPTAGHAAVAGRRRDIRAAVQPGAAGRYTLPTGLRSREARFTGGTKSPAQRSPVDRQGGTASWRGTHQARRRGCVRAEQRGRQKQRTCLRTPRGERAPGRACRQRTWRRPWVSNGTAKGPATAVQAATVSAGHSKPPRKCSCRRNARCQALTARRPAPGAAASARVCTLGASLVWLHPSCEPRLAAPRSPAASARYRLVLRRPSRRTRHGLWWPLAAAAPRPPP